MFCHHCGALLPEDALFCSKCGTQMYRGLTERESCPPESVPVSGPCPSASGMPESVAVQEPVSAPELLPGEGSPAEAEQQVRTNVALTVDDILREELENRQRESAAYSDSVVAHAARCREEPAHEPVSPVTRPVPPPETPRTELRTAPQPASVSTGRARKTVRNVLWCLIALLFAAAEAYLYFFAELSVGGAIFRWALMACVLVLALALLLIIGIACAVPKARGSGS